jgi:hypothetical protein
VLIPDDGELLVASSQAIGLLQDRSSLGGPALLEERLAEDKARRGIPVTLRCLPRKALGKGGVEAGERLTGSPSRSSPSSLPAEIRSTKKRGGRQSLSIFWRYTTEYAQRVVEECWTSMVALI